MTALPPYADLLSQAEEAGQFIAREMIKHAVAENMPPLMFLVLALDAGSNMRDRLIEGGMSLEQANAIMDRVLVAAKHEAYEMELHMQQAPKTAQ